jgi:hypothetical protein
MNTHVVITTINKPTDSIRAWAKLYPDRVLVVGDEKTPAPWECDGVTYDRATAGSSELSWLIGPNKYQRKVLGYVAASRAGADAILDTDDDNEPLAGEWPAFEFTGATTKGAGWCNPYLLYGPEERYGVFPWPRGLPLTSTAVDPDFAGNSYACNVGVWQGLANGDPDVDAIWRMLDGQPVEFEQMFPLELNPGTLAPINSQATLFRRECFLLLYLPCTVSMRVCDILRGYVAQPIMWAAGYRLGFCGPMVRQKRNPHDLMDDFRQELPLYMGMGEAVVEAVAKAVSHDRCMADNLRAAYRAIVGIHGIGDESAMLEEWLKAIGEGR